MSRSPRRAVRSGSAGRASFALRSQLIDAIRGRIEHLGLKQAHAARQLRITAPRLNLLMNGHAELFSVDALIDLTVKLGLIVRLRITRPYRMN
jgi:predicted XRE-type DNA-binding protein